MLGTNLNKLIALYGGTWWSTCDQLEIIKQHFVNMISIYVSRYTDTRIHPHPHARLFGKSYQFSGIPPPLKVKSLFPLGLINLKAVVLKKNKKTTGNICTVFFRGTKCFFRWRKAMKSQPVTLNLTFSVQSSSPAPRPRCTAPRHIVLKWLPCRLASVAGLWLSQKNTPYLAHLCVFSA